MKKRILSFLLSVLMLVSLVNVFPIINISAATGISCSFDPDSTYVYGETFTFSGKLTSSSTIEKVTVGIYDIDDHGTGIHYYTNQNVNSKTFTLSNVPEFTIGDTLKNISETNVDINTLNYDGITIIIYVLSEDEYQTFEYDIEFEDLSTPNISYPDEDDTFYAGDDITIKWSSVTGAESFEWKLYEETMYRGDLIDYGTTGVSSSKRKFTIDGEILKAGKTYTFYVRATNDYSTSKWKMFSFFVTSKHSYGAWTTYDDLQHKRSCTCGEVEYANHNWDDGIVIKQPTPTADGEKIYTCIECKATKKEKIDFELSVVADLKSAAPSLGADLSLYVYADITAKLNSVNLAGADISKYVKLRVTMNSKTTDIAGVFLSGNQYSFKFTGIAPQCIGDNIDLSIIYNDGTKDVIVDTIEDYSIIQYCNKLLALTNTQLGMSETKFSKLKILIADLVAYSVAAQDFINYKTDASLTVSGATPSTFVKLTGGDTSKSTTKVPGLDFKSATLYFYNVNILQFDFEASDITGVKVKINGKEKDYVSIDTSKKLYRVETDDIYANAFDRIYTVELLKNGEVAQTLTYSIKSYVYSKQGKVDSLGTPTAMAILAQRTWNYGASARAFVNHVDTYTVTFVDHDGTILKTQKNIVLGTSAKAPAAPSREGYRFAGWDKSFDNITSDITVSAIYIQQFKVSFVDYNGTVLKDAWIDIGSSATLPSTPSRSGYTFNGWRGLYNNVYNNQTVQATYIENSTWPTVKITNGTGTVGETISLYIDLSNNSGFISESLLVDFDDTALKLIAVKDLGIIPGAMHTELYVSPYVLTWENDERTTDVTSNGRIVELIFEISSNATEGVYDITLSIPRDGIINANGQSLSYITVNGFVAVSEGVRDTHRWDKGTIVTEPTENSTGLIVYTCRICGETKTEILETLSLQTTATTSFSIIDEFDDFSSPDIAVYASGTYDLVIGDVNNDGYVTNLDRYTINRYLAGKASITNENAADINRDGKITLEDLDILSKHLANYQGYQNLNDFAVELTVSAVMVNKSNITVGENVTLSVVSNRPAGDIMMNVDVYLNGSAIDHISGGETLQYNPAGEGVYSFNVLVKDRNGNEYQHNLDNCLEVEAPLPPMEDPVLMYPNLPTEEDDNYPYFDDDFTLRWNEVEGAVSYTIKFSLYEDGDWEEEETIEVITDPFYEMCYEDAFTSVGKCEFKIFAYDKNGNSSVSDLYYFQWGDDEDILVGMGAKGSTWTTSYEEATGKSIWVQSNSYWEAEVSADWITLKKKYSEGDGIGQVKFDVDEHNGDFARTGTITVINENGGKAVFTIVQGPDDSSNQGYYEGITYPEYGDVVDYKTFDIEWDDSGDCRYKLVLKDITANKTLISTSDQLTSGWYEVPKSKLSKGHIYQITVTYYGYSNGSSVTYSSVFQVEGDSEDYEDIGGGSGTRGDTGNDDGATSIILSGLIDGAVVDKRDLHISWEEVLGAEEYYIALRDLTLYPDSLDENNVVKALDIKLDDLSYIISSGKLIEGHSYRLWISAMKSDGTSLVGKTFRFTVKAAANSGIPSTDFNTATIQHTIGDPFKFDGTILANGGILEYIQITISEASTGKYCDYAIYDASSLGNASSFSLSGIYNILTGSGSSIQSSGSGYARAGSQSLSLSQAGSRYVITIYARNKGQGTNTIIATKNIELVAEPYINVYDENGNSLNGKTITATHSAFSNKKIFVETNMNIAAWADSSKAFSMVITETKYTANGKLYTYTIKGTENPSGVARSGELRIYQSDSGKVTSTSTMLASIKVNQSGNPNMPVVTGASIKDGNTTYNLNNDLVLKVGDHNVNNGYTLVVNMGNNASANWIVYTDDFRVARAYRKDGKVYVNANALGTTALYISHKYANSYDDVDPSTLIKICDIVVGSAQGNSQGLTYNQIIVEQFIQELTEQGLLTSKQYEYIHEYNIATLYHLEENANYDTGDEVLNTLLGGDIIGKTWRLICNNIGGNDDAELEKMAYTFIHTIICNMPSLEENAGNQELMVFPEKNSAVWKDAAALADYLDKVDGYSEAINKYNELNVSESSQFFLNYLDDDIIKKVTDGSKAVQEVKESAADIGKDGALLAISLIGDYLNYRVFETAAQLEYFDVLLDTVVGNSPEDVIIRRAILQLKAEYEDQMFAATLSMYDKVEKMILDASFDFSAGSILGVVFGGTVGGQALFIAKAADFAISFISENVGLKDFVNSKAYIAYYGFMPQLMKEALIERLCEYDGTAQSANYIVVHYNLWRSVQIYFNEATAIITDDLNKKLVLSNEIEHLRKITMPNWSLNPYYAYPNLKKPDLSKFDSVSNSAFYKALLMGKNNKDSYGLIKQWDVLCDYERKLIISEINSLYNFALNPIDKVLIMDVGSIYWVSSLNEHQFIQNGLCLLFINTKGEGLIIRYIDNTYNNSSFDYQAFKVITSEEVSNILSGKAELPNEYFATLRHHRTGYTYDQYDYSKDGLQSIIFVDADKGTSYCATGYRRYIALDLSASEYETICNACLLDDDYFGKANNHLNLIDKIIADTWNVWIWYDNNISEIAKKFNAHADKTDDDSLRVTVVESNWNN